MLQYLVVLLFGVSFHSCEAQLEDPEDLSSRAYIPWLWNPNYRYLRSSGFTYQEPHGVSDWPLEFPECEGRRQSPIDIKNKDFLNSTSNYKLTFYNYDSNPLELQLENTGHSLQLAGRWRKYEDPCVQGGPLRYKYCFSQLHFHWGYDNKTGSEHTIEEKSYPMEMHVVNIKKEEGNKSGGQLAVIGYFFVETELDNPALAFFDDIHNVKGVTGLRTNTKPFKLSTLVRAFDRNYVSYSGSLTTPPCTEGVEWIISSRPLPVSRRQMRIIRNAIQENGKNIENHRPPQPLNGRDVRYVFK